MTAIVQGLYNFASSSAGYLLAGGALGLTAMRHPAGYIPTGIAVTSSVARGTWIYAKTWFNSNPTNPFNQTRAWNSAVNDAGQTYETLLEGTSRAILFFGKPLVRKAVDTTLQLGYAGTTQAASKGTELSADLLLVQANATAAAGSKFLDHVAITPKGEDPFQGMTASLLNLAGMTDKSNQAATAAVVTIVAGFGLIMYIKRNKIQKFFNNLFNDQNPAVATPRVQAADSQASKAPKKLDGAQDPTKNKSREEATAKLPTDAGSETNKTTIATATST